MAVAEFGNYSIAAERAAMSTTAISEHLARLRDQVGKQLLVKREGGYELTDAGILLHQFIRRLDDLSGEFQEQLLNSSNSISGLVRYAQPPSCLFSRHFLELLNKRKKQKNLELKVEVMPSEDVLRLVENRTFDFGFVTEQIEHQALLYRVFCEEEYILVSDNSEKVNALTTSNLTHQRFVNYPGMDHYFNQWRQHYFPEASQISDRSLHHSGDINSIEGAIKMVAGGLGMSVFPRHCVQSEINSGQLFEAKFEGREPLLHPIHMVQRKNRSLPKRVSTVINWFFDMRPELSPFWSDIREKQTTDDNDCAC